MNKGRAGKKEVAICPICYWPYAKVKRHKGKMGLLDCPKCKKQSWAKIKKEESNE